MNVPDAREVKVGRARTIIPSTDKVQHPATLRVYLTLPFRRYGQPTFAANAGAMLQNAIIP